ncbi:hypothetical protein [Ensifer sp. LC163]|uniref:hypothetical protein n=1 Tax=Ensifer sp. LC163 TaxID=1120652 RepID=UPI000813341F|nr:hypothetical protein [Ensifer sp. LC163]OCP37926.1 hypothetical protein BC360_19970 [Ensifer sp. LC163]
MIDKPDDDTRVTVEGAYFGSFTEAIRSDGGDCLFINHNRAVSNDVFLNVTEDGRNSEMNSNDVLGGSGFHFSKTSTFEAEGVLIFGNKVRPSFSGTYCVQLECGLDITIEANCFDQITTGPGIFIDGQVKYVREIVIAENWIGRASGAAGADYGLFGVGQIRSITSSMNKYVGFRQAAINMNGLAGGTLIGFVSSKDRFHHPDPSVRDIQLTCAEAVWIDGADFAGTAAIVENTGVDGTVTNCDFSKVSNLTTGILTAGLRYGGQRKGMTLLNKGTTSIPSTGTPTPVVTHGLTYTPSAADINIVCTNNPTDDPARFVSRT